MMLSQAEAAKREIVCRDLLLSLANDIANLTPARRDYHPGIGPGMLNSLIDKAQRAIALAKYEVKS